MRKATSKRCFFKRDHARVQTIELLGIVLKLITGRLGELVLIGSLFPCSIVYLLVSKSKWQVYMGITRFR